MLSRDVIRRKSGLKVLAIFLGLGILAFINWMLPGKKLGEDYQWTRAVEAPQPLSQTTNTPPITSGDIVSLLKHVTDPELKINIVDLGLIYDVVVDPPEVWVTMTLTVPTCPFAGLLISDVRDALFTHPGIHDIHLHLTFDPPWTVNRISVQVREKLLGIPTARGKEAS